MYSGKEAVGITSSHRDLDVTASRTENKIFLHVINTDRRNSVKAGFDVEGMRVKSGKVHFIALEPEYEVFEYKPEITSLKTQDLLAGKEWTFPASSVSAVELEVEEEA
jgi:alpha-L-arabinofuranosidase